nr:MAG TPA: protein of unknown function (DUF5490) [Caudoviricetes sp.]
MPQLNPQSKLAWQLTQLRGRFSEAGFPRVIIDFKTQVTPKWPERLAAKLG